MDLEVIAPMVVAIVFILAVAGTAILRPISKKLGDLLEVMALERREPRAQREIEQLRDLLDTVNGRLALLEERVDFQESLLTGGAERRALPRERAEGE